MSKASLTFLSLNLLHGGELFEQIKSFIKEVNPDILCLQEAQVGIGSSLPRSYRTVEELQKILPGFQHYFSSAMLWQREKADVEFGNLIFSRFPIIQKNTVFFDVPYQTVIDDSQKTDFSREPRNMQIVEVMFADIPLTIANVHGIWGLDGIDNPRRLAMSKTIVANLKDKKHVILSGDFNLRPNTQTIVNIEKQLTNVFKDELVTTFNMKRKTNSGYATAVVDMVFVSKNIEVISKSCPEVDISDHLPLLCTFSVL